MQLSLKRHKLSDSSEKPKQRQGKTQVRKNLYQYPKKAIARVDNGLSCKDSLIAHQLLLRGRAMAVAPAAIIKVTCSCRSLNLITICKKIKNHFASPS
jgi:hypothetical protein